MHSFKIQILTILILLSSTVSCQINPLPEDQNMTASELKEAIVNDSSLVILDVRTPAELNGEHGKIEGVINIPVEELSERVDELVELKEKNFAVICRSGNRSIRATSTLVQNGYKAKNVIGGMKAYNKL